MKAIDLSTNGLTTLPMELFSLPSLRNLHASDNPLVHLHKDLKVSTRTYAFECFKRIIKFQIHRKQNISKPISAPLRLINIASCKLNKIPDFGVLPGR